VAASDLTPILAGIWVWQDYDSSVKADLFSTALATTEGLYLVDPIPLPDSPLSALSQAATIAGMIVTNANHSRASSAYSDRLSVPIFAKAQSFPDSKPARFTEAKSTAPIGGELEVIEIEGAIAGEIALYHASNAGTLIVGDALINFEPHGFSLLPRKYCLNQKQMRSSLHQLLERSAERVLFAHGTPILSGATARLRRLLDAGH
jgi:glyoxylase-like metal-dependent hydrolase (beta-lactamase superfamily II)